LCVEQRNSCFERAEELKCLGTNLKNQNSNLGRKLEEIEVGEYLLSLNAESYIFQFAIQIFND
jgi:hypothetical protein